MCNSTIMKPIYLFLFLFLLAACQKQVPTTERALYYWKNTTNSLTGEEKQALTNLGVQKLYVKFFELESNAEYKVVPTAKTHLKLDESLLAVEIVPTIFVRNEVFKTIPTSFIDSLAGKMLQLTDKYYKEKFGDASAAYQELQIDCDWTAKTKDMYFALLKALKKQSKKRISCTLRLYPYKYPDKMGIPPVHKVMLMCYNLIGPLENEHKNSILSIEELVPYLKGTKDYPLPIDIALPVFSWMQVYQYDRFVGLLIPPDAKFDTYLEAENDLWFRVKKDTVIGHLYLRTGDRIKNESISDKILEEAALQLKKYIKLKKPTTIAFFHLDESHINKDNYENLNRLYATFTQ